MLDVLAWVALAAIGTAVVWKGSGLLESSSGKLSAHYRLPPVVHGSIVVAVGSSFPELSTTVLSALIHGEFELGIAAIVGSAIFNILVIPALCGLFSANRLESNRELVYKESQFYMVSVAVLLITFAMAAIYNPVAQEASGLITGELTRALSLIPIAFYLLYVLIQYLETREHPAEKTEETIRPLREWMIFAVSLLVIVAGVEGLVRSAINLGEIFETPSFLWGFTMVAAGTSLPDAFVSIRAARKNEGVTALANVLGSNVFDLLIAIPAGVLVAGATVINFSVAAPMMGLLTVATVALFVAMRTGMLISRRESVALLALYAVMVTWVTLESLGITSVLSGLLQTVE
ncbi:sodium:calcium antiporter [Jiella sp. KSK16Y-1]|uniref:Sodium:calcium antiporter n=1 Tax=Jiella mangrovi TaxID=2821407 RepID=A0ABS4BLF8_9HYPH|nr:sodium:calcium antiporter [Jiella mangrovi]MBP0617031.1 sodium:calcium antiporter [Jiella mangrovi]